MAWKGKLQKSLGRWYLLPTVQWETNRNYTGKQSEYNTDQFTRVAMDFMEQSLDGDKPFFVELALHAVHLPLNVDAPEHYAKRFNTGYKSIDQFYSHVYGVDQSVKRIVDMLKQRGVWENTILFFMSDNGATCKVGAGDLSLIPGNGQYRGHKGQYYLGGTRVPLMMVWPDKIKKPVQIEQSVSLMDVIPTALEAAGAAIPDRYSPTASFTTSASHPRAGGRAMTPGATRA